MKNIRLSTQIAASLLIVAILVGLGIGEIERRFETKRLSLALQEQADLTVSLIGGLLIEAILIRDTPVIDTALQEAVERNPKLTAITVFDADGKILSYFSSDANQSEEDTRKFSKTILFEGDNFGSMDVIWSTVQGQRMIAQNVNIARIKTLITLVTISLLFCNCPGCF